MLTQPENVERWHVSPEVLPGTVTDNRWSIANEVRLTVVGLPPWQPRLLSERRFAVCLVSCPVLLLARAIAVLGLSQRQGSPVEGQNARTCTKRHSLHAVRVVDAALVWQPAHRNDSVSAMAAGRVQSALCGLVQVQVRESILFRLIAGAEATVCWSYERGRA